MAILIRESPTTPLTVIAEVTDGEITDADVREYLGHIAKLLAKGVPYLLITVLNDCLPTLAQRKMINDYLHKHATAVGELCVASLVVALGRLARALVNAVLWMWRPSIRVELVATRDKALKLASQIRLEHMRRVA